MSEWLWSPSWCLKYSVLSQFLMGSSLASVWGMQAMFRYPQSLQFLLGRKEEEAVLVGGEWSPSLDGLDPQADPQVLVRTAIRCAQAQTGIDLSACTKW